MKKHSAKGFTLFELVVVSIIISILAGLFMNRMLAYQELTEKVAMEQVAASLQTALDLQYAQLQTRGLATDVAPLLIDNPMNFLQKRPRNYAGEFYDATPLSVAPGNWLFDLKSRQLVYVVQHTQHFQADHEGRRWIRFHAISEYEKSRLVSLQNAPAELTGLLFVPVEPYVWE